MKTFYVILSTLISLVIYSQNTPLINGYFENNAQHYIASGQRFDSNSSSVVFVENADTIVDPQLGVNAGIVKINTTTLPCFDNKFYGDTTNSIDYSQQSWIVQGGNTIPYMNFTITQPFPEFEFATNSQARAIPNDTIYKNDTLIINLANISNADSLIINISDGFGSENDSLLTNGGTYDTGRVFLSFVFSAANASSIGIPSRFFDTLHEGPRAYITVQAANYTFQVIEGKNFLFKNIYTLGEGNLYIKK